MRIYFTGPESVRHLSEAVEDFLDNVIECDHEIYVGDNHGFDCLVQSYLASSNYRNVKVITKETYPRCNAAAWKVIRTTSKEKVINHSDFVFASWDGIDKNIFSTIYNVLNQKKPFKIYLTHLGKFENISSKRELHNAMVCA